MHKQFKEADVNRASVAVLLNALEERNLLPESVRADSSSRLRWSTFCDLLEVAAVEIGIEEIKNLSAKALEIPKLKRRLKTAKLFLTLEDAYRFMLQSRTNSEFPHVSAIIRTERDHIDLYGYLDDGVQPSELFFKVMEGSFDQLRIQFGVKGYLTAENSDRHCHYRLTFDEDFQPPSALFRRFSSFCFNLLSLPHITIIRDVLDARTLRLEDELQARNHAERLLNKTENQLARRLENIHDVLLEFNAEAQLIYISPNLKTKFGYDAEELKLDPLAIFPAEHKLNVSEHLARKPDSSEIYQLNLVKKDGTLAWHEISSSCFLVGDKNHVILVARDISERRLMDTEKLNTQKLESLGQLTGAIAHDFNNLLVPILGNVELLAEHLDPTSSEAKFADEIKIAATKASALTKQLLVYSGDRYEQRRFDLAIELGSLLNLIRVSIPRNIRFHHDIEKELFVFGDAIQLRQAVMNVVSNAAEAIGTSDGDVNLSVKKVDGRIKVSVQDTGAGLSDIELSQAFEPLFSTKMVGRGLGLSAVQTIVDAHKGEIVVDSNLGSGTHFEIWLPIATREVIEANSPAKSGTQRVLIVDDEDAVRKVAELVLTRLGFEVISEGDSVKALEIFKQQHEGIDLVMLDLMMPQLNGFQLLGAMRDINPNLPALMVTGFGAGVELDEQQNPEITAILRKPYFRADLESKLHQLIESPV